MVYRVCDLVGIDIQLELRLRHIEVLDVIFRKDIRVAGKKRVSETGIGLAFIEYLIRVYPGPACDVLWPRMSDVGHYVEQIVKARMAFCLSCGRLRKCFFFFFFF